MRKGAPIGKTQRGRGIHVLHSREDKPEAASIYRKGYEGNCGRPSYLGR